MQSKHTNIYIYINLLIFIFIIIFFFIVEIICEKKMED